MRQNNFGAFGTTFSQKAVKKLIFVREPPFPSLRGVAYF